VFDRLRADHRRVLREIGALERALAARDAAEARGRGRAMAVVLDLAGALASRLGRQFDTHMAAEDDVLFPRLAANIPGGAAFVKPLHAEHAELRAMLAALSATLARRAGAARDEQLVVQSHDLIDLLRIHIRKEEALVFRVAERVLSAEVLEALAARRAPGREPARAMPARSKRKKGKPS
jgi:hypothetical protein